MFGFISKRNLKQQLADRDSDIDDLLRLLEDHRDELQDIQARSAEFESLLHKQSIELGVLQHRLSESETRINRIDYTVTS